MSRRRGRGRRSYRRVTSTGQPIRILVEMPEAKKPPPLIWTDSPPGREKKRLMFPKGPEPKWRKVTCPGCRKWWKTPPYNALWIADHIIKCMKEEEGGESGQER